MKNYLKPICLLILLLFILGVTSKVLAAKPTSQMIVTLKPLSYPAKGGPIKLQLSFKWRNNNLKHNCDKVVINTIEVDNLIYNGTMSWEAIVEDEERNTYILDVIVPPDDTSGIYFRLDGGRCIGTDAAIYFVTTSDNLEIYPGNPKHSTGIARHPEPKPDTTKYDFLFDLTEPGRLEFLKQYEDKYLKITPTEKTGFYIIHTTIKIADKLRREGFKCEPLEDVPGFQAPPSTR